MKYALWIALAAVGAFAADVTGTWTGNIIPDGEGRDTAHLVLKQDGTKVTGTAGPRADEQHEIQNGKIEDGKLTFQVGDNGKVLSFVLKVDGDEIKGEVSGEHGGEKRHAKLELTRSK